MKKKIKKIVKLLKILRFISKSSFLLLIPVDNVKINFYYVWMQEKKIN